MPKTIFLTLASEQLFSESLILPPNLEANSSHMMMMMMMIMMTRMMMRMMMMMMIIFWKQTPLTVQLLFDQGTGCKV